MLLDEIVGSEHRTSKHELPTNPHALHLEGSRHVEMTMVPGDQDKAPLRCNHLANGLPDIVDFIEVRDIVHGLEAQLPNLLRHVSVMIDNVVSSEFPAPLATFRARSRRDYRQARQFRQLHGHRSHTTSASNNEKRLSGISVRVIKINSKSIKQRLPSRESCQWKRRTLHRIERCRTFRYDALIHQLILRIRPRTRDISCEVNLITFREESNFITNTYHRTRGIKSQRLRISSLSRSHFVVHRIHRNGLDLH